MPEALRIHPRNPPSPPPVPPPVLAEVALRDQIPRVIGERGDDYFVRGRVRMIRDEGGGALHAHVQGGRSYEVDLLVEGDSLTVRCDCQYYVDRGDACKHIWAAIRAASARHLLPEKQLALICEEVGPRFIAAPPLRLVPQSRAWERFFEAVGPSPVPRTSKHVVPDEIAYVVKRSSQPTVLALHIMGRSRKKNGEWSKWKLIALDSGDLHA